MKLLYNEEKNFSTKKDLPLAKLDMFGSRLVSNGTIFSGDTPVDIQLATFLLLSNVSQLRIGETTKEMPVKYILPTKKSYPFSDNCATFLLYQLVSFHPLNVLLYLLSVELHFLKSCKVTCSNTACCLFMHPIFNK